MIKKLSTYVDIGGNFYLNFKYSTVERDVHRLTAITVQLGNGNMAVTDRRRSRACKCCTNLFYFFIIKIGEKDKKEITTTCMEGPDARHF